MKAASLLVCMLLLNACGKPKLHCARAILGKETVAEFSSDSGTVKRWLRSADSILFSPDFLQEVFELSVLPEAHVQHYRDSISLEASGGGCGAMIFVWQKEKDRALRITDTIASRLLLRLEKLNSAMEPLRNDSLPPGSARTAKKEVIYMGRLPLGDHASHYDAYKCF